MDLSINRESAVLQQCLHKSTLQAIANNEAKQYLIPPKTDTKYFVCPKYKSTPTPSMAFADNYFKREIHVQKSPVDNNEAS